MSASGGRKSSSASARLRPPPGGAVIRMYRQGLGDSFLLAFAGKSRNAPVYVLVDCGAHFAQRGGRETMLHVIDDLIECTGGRIDVVVAALEKLKRDRSSEAASTRGLAARLDAANQFFAIDDQADDDTIPALARKLGLAEPEKVTGNELSLALLKDIASEIRFFSPGDASVPVPGAANSRAYVLGPPRRLSLLKVSDPSGGDRHETFLTSAVGHGNGTGEKLSPEYQRFFDHFYGISDSWRNIDRDWLFAAGELALHLDRHTNNTSLALAFELGEPGAGPVLLFPADAQVGNWLSWQSLTWQLAGRHQAWGGGVRESSKVKKAAGARCTTTSRSRPWRTARAIGLDEPQATAAPFSHAGASRRLAEYRGQP